MDHNAAPPSNPTRLGALLRLMRPQQWVKNGFVLAPLMFTGSFFDPVAVRHALTAVFLFCLASSITYIVNDLLDIERDRQHPVKRTSRPLAAGWISTREALSLAALLGTLIFAVGPLLPRTLSVIGVYLLLNVAYSTVLKHQPVIDIFTIALGFVLRIYAGAFALQVPVSSWMAITTLCLALYLAAVKRKQELSAVGTEGREVLKAYSVQLTERYAEMSATGALMFYSLFVLTNRPGLVITIPLVLFGLFRYWYVVDRLEGGESPTDVLLSDRPLAFTVIAWVGACAWALRPGGA